MQFADGLFKVTCMGWASQDTVGIDKIAVVGDMKLVLFYLDLDTLLATIGLLASNFDKYVQIQYAQFLEVFCKIMVRRHRCTCSFHREQESCVLNSPLIPL